MSNRTATQRLLRGALLGNAVFSTICVILIAADGVPLAELMGLASAVPLYVVAMGLVPFAIALIANARRDRVSTPQAVLASIGDATWVVASIGLLAVWPEWFSATGMALVAGVAAAVALFGALQSLGVRRILRNERMLGVPRPLAT